VAFEPGGSVSLDKPPLGYWVQAFSAYFLGLNGFALALPNAIAGVLSVFVVFKLVRQTFGDWAGLLAAFTLAITPIAIATERNNTIDGLLVFVLLLAAWAFMQSIQSGNFRWLLLGALLVGLGFNIKMLQALLPLPAFYAAYFFGAKHNWRVKLSHLTAASTLLLAVSLSWALVVDMIPASERPYVDSSSNNSVMSLIFGHNGLTRLTNARVTLDGLEDPIRLSPPGDTNANTSGNQPTRPSDTILPHAGKPPQPSAGLPHQMDAGRASGPGGNMDFGRAGTLRLFSMPLADVALVEIKCFVVVDRVSADNSQVLVALHYTGLPAPGFKRGNRYARGHAGIALRTVRPIDMIATATESEYREFAIQLPVYWLAGINE